MSAMSKEVILTGLRANNVLHIGNYLGAILPMVSLQHKLAGQYQINMFVPDLHSFTTPIDHDDLYENSLDNLKVYVAAGLDLDSRDTYIYRQSYISAHSELTWILDCFTGFGEMSRMIQFKEKSKSSSGASVGLFNYPVLMAADILLYGARWIPVGDDQRQHVEITRDIAERINEKFKSVYPDGIFVLPEPTKKQNEFIQLDSGLRVRDLVTPTKKMSKSDETGKGVIFLNEDPSVAAKKVMSATTDNVGVINFDWANQPGVTNLLQMLALLSGRDQASVNADWIGKTSYGELKQAVAKQVEIFLNAFQVAYNDVNVAKLITKLEADEAAMTKVANAQLLKAQRAVGLRPRD